MLPDPDVEVGWNEIFDNLNDLNYCLDNKNSELTPAALEKHSEEYHIVSLTSRVEYLPQENYYDGAYHNDSDSYPTNYAFTLKPTDSVFYLWNNRRTRKTRKRISSIKKI